MSRENRLPDYLERVQREAADACRFVAGMRLEDFLADERTKDAVTASLYPIGGMLNRIEELYPEFFAAYPEVAWRELRDACVDFLENCLDVDPEKVWGVTQMYLPALLAVLPSIDADAWVPISKAPRAGGRNQAAKPSAVLNRNRQAIREAVARNKTANPRVFGSVIRGEDTEGSDIDILVDTLPGTSLFNLGGLQSDLEDLLGVKVDVVTAGELPGKWREEVLAEALPV